MKIQSYDLNFYTAYHQFYICDKLGVNDTGSPEFWTEEAFEDRLAIESNILGIGTECYGQVKARVIIRKDSNIDFNFNLYDHIVEGSLELKSGIMQIMDCPNSHIELELNLKPDQYRVRIYSQNLKSVIGDNADDFYIIEIWQEVFSNRKVLKRYVYQKYETD